jgi:flagellar biosynthesis repressor protein FlbT
MSLKLTLKPHERIIIDSAVVTNGNAHVELMIENNVPILRQKNILTEKEANTPCRRIYFVIQLMYVDTQNLKKYHKMYWDLVHDLVEAAPGVLELIDRINNHILNEEYYLALKLARKLIDYEEEAVSRVSECPASLSIC